MTFGKNTVLMLDRSLFEERARQLCDVITGAVDVMAEAFPGCSRFVFVGLNALNECEKRVMGKMRDARLAQFCWDYSSSLIKTPHNRSSLFMNENVERFPQAFLPQYEDRIPQVNVISVPSDKVTSKAPPSPTVIWLPSE